MQMDSTLTTTLIILVSLHGVRPLLPVIEDQLQACTSNGPLGLISGFIEDWQITASSTYPTNWDAGCHERYARVYQPNGVAWCAKHKSASEWLQIDLGVPAKVTGLMTQGRADGIEWVTSYMVSYSLDAYHWIYITDYYGNRRVFDGNSDAYQVKHAYLDEPVIARYVKFHTTRWNRHPSLRVEVIGCQVCRNPIALPPYGKISASSERSSSNSSSCLPEDGYIITQKGWCAKEDNANQWLQFDVGPPTLVTGVVTRGRGDSNRRQWVTRFLVSYSNDTSVWYFYKDASHLDIKRPDEQPTHLQSASTTAATATATTMTTAATRPVGSKKQQQQQQQQPRRRQVPEVVDGVALEPRHSSSSASSSLSAAVSRTGSTSPSASQSSIVLIPDRRSAEGVEFGANSDRDTARYHYFASPFVARYVRFHPVEWLNHVSMRAGLIGCPHHGDCGPGFLRVVKSAPCVENVAYKKDSWINNKRQLKRHVRNQWTRGHASRAVDGDPTVATQTCTVLDNFYVDRPTLLVDLGHRTRVSGIKIVTWQGHSDGSVVADSQQGSYVEYMANLDRLTVYVDNVKFGSGAQQHKQQQQTSDDASSSIAQPQQLLQQQQQQQQQQQAENQQQAPVPGNVCGFVSRFNDAIYRSVLHVQCARPLYGRYVYVEASGVASRRTRLFSAVLCEVMVYQ